MWSNHISDRFIITNMVKLDVPTRSRRSRLISDCPIAQSVTGRPCRQRRTSLVTQWLHRHVTQWLLRPRDSMAAPPRDSVRRLAQSAEAEAASDAFASAAAAAAAAATAPRCSACRLQEPHGSPGGTALFRRPRGAETGLTLIKSCMAAPGEQKRTAIDSNPNRVN